MKHADLIARLEAKTGPDREIDAAIFKAFNPEYGSDDWQIYGPGLRHKNDSSDMREMPSVRFPAYTASIDAAIALVEWLFPVSAFQILQKAVTSLHYRGRDLKDLPRRILIAALKAHGAIHDA